MKTKYGYIGLLLAAILLMGSGCKPDRKDRGWQNQGFALDENTAADASDSADFILRKAMLHNTRFSTFSTPLDIKIDVDQTQIGLGGQLRIENGRILWGTLSKLFFEIGRFKITPDSMLFYSKMGNTASLYTDDTAGKSLMPVVFGFTQSLFMRQVDPVMLKGERTLSLSEPDRWTLEGLASDSVAWQIIIRKADFRIDGMTLRVLKNGTSAVNPTELQAELQYFQENGFAIRLAVDRQLIVKARVTYAKPRWNTELTYPFAIPASIPVDINRGLIKSLENGSLD